MECICTKCGTLWESEELAFNLTKRIGKEVERAIRTMADSGQKAGLLEACREIFPEGKEKTMYKAREEELWELPQIGGRRDAQTQRYVKYTVPYDEILRGLETVKNSRDNERDVGNIKALGQWIEEKKADLKGSYIVLFLQKTGDGDIHFDRILDGDTNEIVSVQRICPGCGNPMSYWSGRYKELRLTVLGGPRVSKSTTLTACADAFLKMSQGIIWEAYGDAGDEEEKKKTKDIGGSKAKKERDESWKEFYDSCLSRYRENMRLIASPLDGIPNVTFRVDLEQGRYLSLTFIDLPGELMRAERSQELYVKYKPFYDNVDFVWYCTDPGEVRQIEGAAEDTEEIRELGYEDDKRVLRTETIAQRMRVLSGCFKMAGRTVPVAYILGKTDVSLISGDERKRYSLYAEGTEDKFNPLDIKQFWEHSWKVREYIYTYNPELIRCFEECFQERCYIALSAYGFDPCNNPENKQKQPYHVTLPFMWMMALRNCIPVRVVYRKWFFWSHVDTEILNDLEDSVRERALENLYTKGAFRI